MLGDVGIERAPLLQVGHGVDHSRFDTAGSMSVPELLQMGEIASSRGDAPAAMEWKAIATERGLRDLSAESQATMERVTMNTYTSPPGQIIERKGGSEPWSDDPDLQAARDRVATVGLTHDRAKAGTAEERTSRRELASAESKLSALKDELREQYEAAGLWTQQHQVQQDARESMASKAAQVAAQVKGQ